MARIIAKTIYFAAIKNWFDEILNFFSKLKIICLKGLTNNSASEKVAITIPMAK